jgi:hypothetical protein
VESLFFESKLVHTPFNFIWVFFKCCFCFIFRFSFTEKKSGKKRKRPQGILQWKIIAPLAKTFRALRKVPLRKSFLTLASLNFNTAKSSCGGYFLKFRKCGFFYYSFVILAKI